MNARIINNLKGLCEEMGCKKYKHVALVSTARYTESGDKYLLRRAPKSGRLFNELDEEGWIHMGPVPPSQHAVTEAPCCAAARDGVTQAAM